MNTRLPNPKHLRRSCVTKKVFLTTLVLVSLIFVSSCFASTLQASPTPISTRSVILPTATLKSIVSTPATHACWKTVLSRDDISALSGSLIYNDDNSEDVLAIDVNSYKTKMLGQQTPLVVTSLDRWMIVESYPLSNKIRFLSGNNDLSVTISKEAYLDIFNAFLYNGQLMLRNGRAQRNNYRENLGTTDEYYILSPITSKSTFQSVFLPQYWDDTSRYGASSSFTRYSPDLKYVIYPSNNQFVLYDIENKKIVWSGWNKQDPSATSLFPAPIWKPDASAVTIVDNDNSGIENFYDISIDGQVKQLTRFDELSSPRVGELVFPLWSPNGRYIAFRTLRHAGDFLLILDTNTGEIINPCISLGQEAYYPVWSPDGNQLAFTPMDKRDAPTKVVIVDLVSQSIYTFNQQLLSGRIQLLGWVNWKIP